MSLTGPLRFDIAPGSSVKIESTPAAGILAKETAAPSYKATVLRVSISISVDPPSANTVFQLGYVRSEAEDNNPAFSSTEHPLWNKETFIGCPLVNFENIAFQGQDTV